MKTNDERKNEIISKLRSLAELKEEREHIDFELEKAVTMNDNDRYYEAFKKARKLGLSFLAKQSSIHAYRSKSLDHAVPLHEHSYGEAIPYYSLNGCITDSGADDEEHFPKGFIER